MDRAASVEAIGDIDSAGGEFWVSNPFAMPQQGENLSAFERNRLFMNVDGKQFVDASFSSKIDLESDSRSPIAADFNGDGYPDLLIGSAGGGPLRMFMNNFPAKNSRIKITLLSSKTNRRGIGARVNVYAGGIRIVRDNFPANGFMGMAPTGLTIGLGKAEKIERLEIRWPTGETQEFENLKANKHFTFHESKRVFDQKDLKALPVRVSKRD